VTFRQPIHVRELVTFLKAVNHTGTSSMEIGIKVAAEDIRTKRTRYVNGCFFTMVAVDDELRPVAVAPLRRRRATRNGATVEQVCARGCRRSWPIAFLPSRHRTRVHG